METLNPGESKENSPLYEKLFKLSIEELKDSCKRNSITGFSKLKKTDIVNLIIKKLSSLKIDELKVLCKNNNLSGYSTLKKDDLISFITTSNIIKVTDTPEEKGSNILLANTQIGVFTTENMLENILNEKKLLEQKEKLIYEQLENERIEKERILLLEKEEKERLELLEKERLELLEKYTSLRDQIDVSNISLDTSDNKNKKKKIPKAVKTHVWNLYIGSHINEHRCLCCKKALIKITDFDTGHVLSESDGGTMEISNLRPIFSLVLNK